MSWVFSEDALPTTLNLVERQKGAFLPIGDSNLSNLTRTFLRAFALLNFKWVNHAQKNSLQEYFDFRINAKS